MQGSGGSFFLEEVEEINFTGQYIRRGLAAGSFF